jgi:hypothetical protein
MYKNFVGFQRIFLVHDFYFGLYVYITLGNTAVSSELIAFKYFCDGL